MRFYVLSISCLIALATATAIPSEELERVRTVLRRGMGKLKTDLLSETIQFYAHRHVDPLSRRMSLDWIVLLQR